jgi:hypothetical protein
MSDDRNRTVAKIAVSALAGLLLWSLVLYGFVSIVHWWRTRDSRLANLVVEIQRNIQQIDAEKSKTGWEVEGAEVEVNFVIKESTENKTELKASSGTLGFERENTGRLLLKLHRTPSVAENMQSNSGVAPTKTESTKPDQPTGKGKKPPKETVAPSTPNQH